MKEKNKKLIKNVGIFTIGSFGSKILSFLLVPLYTAVLSTQNYGTADLISTTASLLIPILTLSIQDAVLRYALDKNIEKNDVINTALRVVIKGSILLAVGIIILNYLKIFQLENIYYWFLFLFFVSGAFNTLFNLYLRGKNKVKVIAASGILNTFITCISNIVFLIVFKFGIIGYLCALFIGELSSAFFQFFLGKIYKDIKLRKYNDMTHEMLRYSIPLIPNSIAWWINNASDRYILTFLRGVAENGIYAVSYKVPTMLAVFQSIFNNAWSISAITEFDENDADGFFGDNYKRYSFFSYLVCSFLILLNIPIAHFLYANEFFLAWKAVPFLLVGTMFNGISIFEGSLYAAVKRTKLVASTTVIGAIINTICNFIFINIYGMVGAALATMIGYTITWLLRTWFLKSIIRLKVNWKIESMSYIAIVLQAFVATFDLNIFIQLALMAIVIIIHKQSIRFIWDSFIKQLNRFKPKKSKV